MTRRKHYKTSVRRIKTLHTSLQRNDKYSICLWHTLYVIIGLYLNEDLTIQLLELKYMQYVDSRASWVCHVTNRVHIA